jgi:C4-dicarboxylate-specific signal transduction histidine kinase
VHWLLHHIVVVDRAMAHQLNASEPALAARVASALLQDVTEDLTDSERHLLAELRRANEELEKQVEERTRELRDSNRRLQVDLDAARAEIVRLKAEIAAKA